MGEGGGVDGVGVKEVEIGFACTMGCRLVVMRRTQYRCKGKTVSLFMDGQVDARTRNLLALP